MVGSKEMGIYLFTLFPKLMLLIENGMPLCVLPVFLTEVFFNRSEAQFWGLTPKNSRR